ncbi:MAG: YraN family protein [Bacteroidota bacterium]|nr:YraN family protein [Bacteroidota bacterium]
MAEHNELGQRGEKIAQSFLADKGYQILFVNWRNGKTEIDIIALDGETLVFVEVKTRHTFIYGEPENAVDFRKQKNIIHAANAFVLKYGYKNDSRFDIVSVITGKGAPIINHLEDAFYPKIQS